MVYLDGKDRYLGRYNSPESWELYHRLLAERAAPSPAGPVAPTPHFAPKMPTVAELALGYCRHCNEHYT